MDAIKLIDKSIYEAALTKGQKPIHIRLGHYSVEDRNAAIVYLYEKDFQFDIRDTNIIIYTPKIQFREMLVLLFVLVIIVDIILFLPFQKIISYFDLTKLL